jgi:hypothetical protein
MRVASAVRAKGITFRSFLTTLERLRGADQVRATLSLVPAEIERAIRLGEIVVNGWYPIDWYRELHAAMNQACSEPGLDLSRRIGRESAIADFRGIYRLLLRVVSSETLVAQAPRLFRMYYEGGEVEMIESDKGFGVLDFRGWQGFDRAMWADVVGGIEGVLVARRAVDVRPRVLRGGGSDGTLRVEYRWSMTTPLADAVKGTLRPPAKF